MRALLSGMVLVVDEADKAPTHVTCILKNIIEGSEITLADGRKIIHRSDGTTGHPHKMFEGLSGVYLFFPFKKKFFSVSKNKKKFPPILFYET